MVRQSSVGVALLLLGCYAGNLVVAQKGAQPSWPAYPPPQDPQPPNWPAHPPPQDPQPPKTPSWPARPHPEDPQPPTWPARPPPQDPQPPKTPSWPARPPPPDPQPPKTPSWPARPPPQDPQPPKTPSWPARPPPPDPQPPKTPSWPAPPPPPDPQPPKTPSWPARPHPEDPQPPTWPARPPPQDPQPPKTPSWPARPPPPDPQPPKTPSWPARPPPPPPDPQPPKTPSWPARPPPPDPQPPKTPSWPARPPPPDPQPPKAPARPPPQYQQPQQAPQQYQQPPKAPERPPPQYQQPQQAPQQYQQPPKAPERPKQPSWPARPPKKPSQIQWDAAGKGQTMQNPEQEISPSSPQSCEVDIPQRVPCGGPDISPAACTAIHCCSDRNGCYYGKAVTVQCTKDASFIVVAARDATLPNIDLESLSLMSSEPGCTHVDFNSLFVIYHFPVTSCGSVVKEDQGAIIYENRLISSYEVGVGPLGSITRDSYFEVRFRCRYLGVSVETLMTETMNLAGPIPIAPVLGPFEVELRLGNGVCTTKGCDEVDVAYDSYYVDSDYPVAKVLRDPVYIEVRLLNKIDPRLILTLGRCWTTTHSNPHSMPQWDILIDGCPNQDDRYLSELIPIGDSSGLQFPSHYKRLLFKMFTFVDQDSSPLREQIHIHCSTEVCTPGQGEHCDSSCAGRKKKREVAVTTVEKDPRMVMTVGPLLMGGGDR